MKKMRGKRREVRGGKVSDDGAEKMTSYQASLNLS